MSRLLLFGAIGLAAVAGLGAIAVTYGGTVPGGGGRQRAWT